MVNACKNCKYYEVIMIDLYVGDDKCMRNVKLSTDPISGKPCYFSLKGALNCSSEREISTDFREYIEWILFRKKRDKCGADGEYFKERG